MSDYPYRVRPIEQWPGELTRERTYSPFRAGLQQTRRQLDVELRALDAHDVLLQIAVRESDLRLDGFPRANARRPEHPGVILTFESRYGPLQYACDQFVSWEDNLRAIALGLESLRRVDRYGITKRGEQYTGWRQLEAGDTSEPLSRLSALGYLVEVVEDANPGRRWHLEDTHRGVRALVHQALKAAHPDTGGDPDVFRRVQAARKVIEAS